MKTPDSTALRRIAALALTCLTLTMNAEPNSEKVLFDFTTATNLPAWQIVNDDVMGGVSRSQFAVLTRSAVFSGVVSLENNGGFASCRTPPGRHDLTGLDAFVVRVRGDGRRYQFTVRTEAEFDAPLYQATIQTKIGEWEEHRLLFKDFLPKFRGRVLTGAPPLNPTTVSSVGFLISDKQAGPFRLEIGSVKSGN